MRAESSNDAAGTFRSAGFFLLVLIVWLVGTAYVSALVFRQGADTRTLYLVSCGVELLMAVPAVGYMLIRKIKPSELFGRARAGQVALGALAGALLVPVSIAVAMLWNCLVLLTGGNIDAGGAPVPQTGAQFLAAFAAVGLAAPAVEEPVMRGLLFNAGAGVLSHRKALLLATLAFAMLHGNFLGFPSIFLGGLLLGVLVWRGGSLWPAVAAHMAYNTIATALETLISAASRAGGVAAAAAPPQPLELLAAAIVFFFISLPFLAALGGVLWGFWRATPQVERPKPEFGKIPFSHSWPWFTAFLLLLCYMAIDVLQVYGIIGVS